jgi:hypothetical protein
MRWGWILACTGVIGYTMIYAIAFERLFLPLDPRTETVEWFFKNAPAGTKIGFATVPWFYSPSLAPSINGLPYKTNQYPDQQIPNRYDAMSESRYRLIARPDKEWDASILTKDKPAYVIISDYEYEDPLRLQLNPAKEFYKKLEGNYVKIKEFKKELSAFGINFGPTTHLPHDLKYMSPTIQVYRRK